MATLSAEEARRLHALHHEAREQNRRLFPEGAAFVDEVRALFGADAKVVYFGDARPESLEHYSDPKPIPDRE